MPELLERFLIKAFASGGVLWDADAIADVASQAVPNAVAASRRILLQGDISILWTRWFIDSIIDTECYDTVYRSYACLVADVIPVFRNIIPRDHNDTSTSSACAIARLIDDHLHRKRQRQRSTIYRFQREQLLDLSQPVPRCWICGFRFSDWAIDRFLLQKMSAPPLPYFVDYFTRHGLAERDLTIEVDHVIPVTEGGDSTDNLRLACGWCNLRKSEHVTIYDVGSAPRVFQHPSIGRTSVPQPFWVVRLLALHGKCEVGACCDKTTLNSQLYVARQNLKGAMNPPNLVVTCAEHDPERDHRLVSRFTFGSSAE